MNTRQSNTASAYLLALARRNAQIYASQLGARAIILTGSAAEGVSDLYSDLDMIVYYDQLPSQKERQLAMEHNQGQEHHLIGQATADEAAESYNVEGVECQIGHTTIAAWEREMATVLEQLDVASPTQKALGGLLDALPLHGEELISSWQNRLADYPDALAQAMVNHYLNFFPLWGLQQRFASRDTTIWFYQQLVESAHHLLGILAGLNRRYYSPFQFKRTGRFIAHLDLAPPNLAERLEATFHLDPATSASLLEELVSETVALVEQQMPQIDTARARQWLGWRQQPWEPA